MLGKDAAASSGKQNGSRAIRKHKLLLVAKHTTSITATRAHSFVDITNQQAPLKVVPKQAMAAVPPSSSAAAQCAGWFATRRNS